MIQRVAIIGGGPAGVTACVELLAVAAASGSVKYAPVIFERRGRVGGVWNHEAIRQKEIKFDAQGRPHAIGRATAGDWPPGAMFEGLRTNIASDLMTYRDAPFPDGTSLFPDRGTVNAYLKHYAEAKGTESYLRLGTTVTRIERLHSDDSKPGRWEVQSSGPDGARVEQYERLILASGRCSRPALPTVAGLWNWKGELLHSSWYRTPLAFRGKKVLVVGNASSGMDIARELNGFAVRPLPLPTPDGAEPTQDFVSAESWAGECTSGASGVQVWQSVTDVNRPPRMDLDPRDPAAPEWARRIQVVPRVARIESGGGVGNGTVVLENGDRLEGIDVIIYATGFLFDFPFLPSEAPFNEHSLLASPPPPAPLSPEDDASLARALEAQGGPFEPQPGSLAMSNLDDWLLFYTADDSVAILGAPTTVIPFHISQAQSRYVASYWADIAKPLPKLDSSLSTTNPARWTSTRSGGSAWPSGQCSHVFGNPSDSAYVDTLLKLIPGAGEEAPWDAEYRRNSDGVGGGEPRAPEDFYKTPTWRRQRRENGRKLRRDTLGY